jgi:hypothetical protein
MDITILQSLDGDLNKRYRVIADGIIRSDFDQPFRFKHHPVAVESIRDLYPVLRALSTEPTMCIVRGRPKPGITVGRRLSNGPDATLDDVPLDWLMLDADGIPMPPGTDPETDGPAILLRELDPYLPGIIDADAVIQWSAGAGFTVLRDEAGDISTTDGNGIEWTAIEPGWSKLKAHIWVRLDRPVSNQTLRDWRADHNVPVDPKVLNPCAPACKTGPASGVIGVQ